MKTKTKITVALAASALFAGIGYEGYTTFIVGTKDASIPKASEANAMPELDPPAPPSAAPKGKSSNTLVSTVKATTTEVKGTSIDSIDALISYLNGGGEAGFDIRPLVDYVNRSQDAFDYIADRYTQENDTNIRDLLKQILAQTSRSEKLEFSFDLMDSHELDDRRSAYNMLKQSQERNNPEVHSALIDATYSEEDPATLTGLISSISSVDPSNAYAKDSAVNRLNELAFHDNPQVAKHAISTVAIMNQSEKTQQMLETHLSTSSDELKISALNGLYYFQDADQALVNRIQKIANDPSSSENVRSVAKDLARSLEEVASLKKSQNKED